MGVWRQILLLQQKDLILLWRNKCLFLVECIFALQLLLPLIAVAVLKDIMGPHVNDGTAYPVIIKPFSNCSLYISGKYAENFTRELEESATRKLNVTLDLEWPREGEECGYDKNSAAYIQAKRIDIDSKKIDYRVVVPDDESPNRKLGWASGNPYLPTINSLDGENALNRDNKLMRAMWTMDLIFLDASGLKNISKDSTFEASEFPRPDIRYNFMLEMILTYAGSSWGVIVLLPMIFTAKEVLAEKEAGIKTYMMVMGMSPTAFYFAHFITGSWKIGFICVVCSIPLLICLPNTFLFFFVIVILYALNAVAFTLLVATIFSRGAVVYGFITLVWLALIVLSVTVTPDAVNVGMTVLSALNPTAAFGIGATESLIYESIGWFPNPFGLLPTIATSGIAILMLILDVFLLVIITLYLDAVFPSGDAPGKSPLFFISWIFRLCRSKDSSTEPEEEQLIASNYDENMEPETGLDLSQADVNVRGLVKKWSNGEVAVNGASLRAYRGQVTVLLGHNGAGKSTTFACLTGFSKATDGQVLICGSNIAENTKECQRFIGYCPQTNPLFAKLTCYEHLRLYGRFRAGKQLVTDEEINRVLDDVGLAEQKNTWASKLSGGMKRKLCVGMALIGQSKVVLLDEPTAGMDPGARFQIREILEKVKRDRTIVLTTHYMDEADALGDRVAIMVKGEIVCNGSPEFLKKKFGTGYILTVSLSATDNVVERVARVLNAVKTKIDGAKLEGSPAPQFNVQLPYDQKKRFGDLFEEMETQKQALGIDSFGLSVSALEQVFIRVGELVDGGDKRDSERARGIAEELCNSTEQKSSGAVFRLMQFLVLMQRYFLYAWRHKIRTLIPFVVVIFAFIPFMANAYDNSRDRTYDIAINAHQLVESVLPVVVRGDGDPLLRHKAPDVARKAARNLVVKDYAASDATKKFKDDFLHTPPLGVGLDVDGENQTAYFNVFLGLGWALAENFMVNALIGRPDAITSGIKKNNVNRRDTSSGTRTSPDGEHYGVSDSPHNVSQGTTSNGNMTSPVREDSGVSSSPHNVSQGTTSSGNMTSPVREDSGVSSSPYNVRQGTTSNGNRTSPDGEHYGVSDSPHNVNQRDSDTNHAMKTSDGSDFLKNLMATLTILLSLSLTVSMMIFTPVAERSTKFKHQLFLTRVWSFQYWIAQLVGDFIHFLAVALLVFAFTWAFTGITLVCAAGMWPLWILYFLAASMLTYCASFVFASTTKAFALMLCWQSIFPLIATVVIGIAMTGIAMFVEGRETLLIISYVFICFAGIVFPVLPLSIGTYMFLAGCAESGMSGTLYWFGMIFIDAKIGAQLVCLFVSTVTFGIVLALVQSRRVKRTKRNDVMDCGPLENEDEDVTKERDRLLEINDSDLALSVRDLNKFYGQLCAVRKLTFGVGHDDCFGLVGVNGAGKTTTFDILTGVSYPSSGSAFVEGVDVSNQPTIGYCPQFDALSPDLTGRETLTLIGRLNGLEGVKSRVEKVLESIQLADEGDKLVKHYSGGQKRRISIGVALMSSSKLIMLDEPTAGVDPRTRRYIWDLLTALRRQNTALLLTSHSMEECEVLCTRIAFMNRGSMISIGTSQHLKSKYCNTFALSLTRENASEQTGEELNTVVIETFHAEPTTDPMEMPTLTWEIPRSPSDSWSEMYRRVERFSSTQPNVKDFSLVQGTLEQVFVRLSKVEVTPTQTSGSPETALPGQPQNAAPPLGTVNAGFDPAPKEDASPATKSSDN